MGVRGGQWSPEERSPPRVEAERSRRALHPGWGREGDPWRLAGGGGAGGQGKFASLRTAVPKRPCHVDQPVVKFSTTCYRNTEIRHQMAAPAVCADKEDSPVSPILGRFHFSAVTPTPLPKPSLSLPVFGRTWESWARKAFLPPGNQAGADSAGNHCVLVAVRGDVPTFDRPILCPAGVSRPPDLPVLPWPET